MCSSLGWERSQPLVNTLPSWSALDSGGVRPYEAQETAHERKPELARLDVGMPRLSGIDAAQEWAEKMPSVVIILVSMRSDERYVMRALKASAKGYVLKACAENDVLNAEGLSRMGGSVLL